MGSPITSGPNDLTTLKIEDLDEAKKGLNAYNPVWKLQITDDANRVKYEGRFLDRNND